MNKLLMKIFQSKAWLPLLLFFIILLNWLAAYYHKRIDLTNEKRFTVSAASKKILRQIDEPIEIKVLLKGDYPSAFRNLGAASVDLLREFKEVAGGKFNYSLIGPDDKIEGTETSYGDSLMAMGFAPINLTTQLKEGQQQLNVFPFAVINYKGVFYPVVLYKGKSPLINAADLNSTEATLEYQFAESISRLTDSVRPLVGYATGQNEPVPGMFNVYDLFENTLRPNFQTFTLDLNQQPFVPQEFAVLMIVKPKAPFSDAVKLKLDQYVMNGGRLLIFLDKLEAEMDSLQIKNQVIAYDRGLSLDDLLFRYGARVNPDLLMDLQCDFLPFDLNGNGQFEFLPWNYFPVLEPNRDHAITRDLGFVSGRFVTSIDTVEADGIRKTILLHSSSNSRTIGSPALISGSENVNAPEDGKFKKSHIPAAVLLEGKFRSLFANRLTRDLSDSLETFGMKFLSDGVNEGKVIVVSDGDVVLNSLVKGNTPIGMGMNPFAVGTQREFPFANRDFLLNCLNYLTDQSGLSEIKAKELTVHVLDGKRVKEEKLFWQLVNILLPILILILFGFIFNWMRRMKYAKRTF